MNNVLSISSLETDILSQTEICVSNGGTGQDKQAQAPTKHSKTWTPMVPISYAHVKKAVVNSNENVRQCPLPLNS